MRIIRVLIYEGEKECLLQGLKYRAVKGSYHYPKGSITEFFPHTLLEIKEMALQQVSEIIHNGKELVDSTVEVYYELKSEIKKD